VSLTFIRNIVFHDSNSQGNIIFYKYTIYSRFSVLRRFFKGSILTRNFQILSNSRIFPGPGKWICYSPGFLGHVGTLIICKAAQFDFLFLCIIFICTSSKLSKVSSTFNPNVRVTTTCSLPYLSGSLIHFSRIYGRYLYILERRSFAGLP